MSNQYGYPSSAYPPAGWYPDPAGSGQERFWDGSQWTGQTRPAVPTPPPPAAQQWQPTQPVQADLSSQPAQPVQPQVQQAYVPMQQPYQPAQPGQSGYPGAQPGYPYQPYTPAMAGAYAWQPGPEYAHWGWRLLAWIIDGLLLGMLGTVVSSPFLGAYNRAIALWVDDVMAASSSGATVLPMPWDYAGFTSGIVISSLISLALFLVYHIAMLSTIGASLGKLAVGVRVVPADDLNARKLSVGTAALRQIMYWLLQVIPIVNIVNGLSPLWRAKRQAYHDSIAKTVVLKVK